MRKTDSLQYRLCTSLKEDIKELGRYNIDEICYMVFKNLQLSHNSVNGLRLTPMGFKLLSKRYDTYKFPISETGIQKRLLIQLHRNMQWPYFIDKKFLYLFNGDDAMWMSLSGSDVEKFVKDLS